MPRGCRDSNESSSTCQQAWLAWVSGRSRLHQGKMYNCPSGYILMASSMETPGCSLEPCLAVSVTNSGQSRFRTCFQFLEGCLLSRSNCENLDARCRFLSSEWLVMPRLRPYTMQTFVAERGKGAVVVRSAGFSDGNWAEFWLSRGSKRNSLARAGSLVTIQPSAPNRIAASSR